MNKITDEIQLDEYFRSKRHSKVALDKKITPLLRYIEKNKVNSIHQMDTKFYQDEFINQYNPQRKGQTVALHKQNIFLYNFAKEQKYISKTLEAITPIKAKSATAKWTSRALYSFKCRAATSIGPSKRLYLSNSPSKLKRHLIQSNNSQVIPIHLHQNSRHINLFQHFCQQIQQREQKYPLNRFRKTINSKKRTENSRLIDNEEAEKMYKYPEIESQSPINDFLKVNQNKKFWNKDQYKKKKQLRRSQQLLSLRGISQMLNLVSL